LIIHCLLHHCLDCRSTHCPMNPHPGHLLHRLQCPLWNLYPKSETRYLCRHWVRVGHPFPSLQTCPRHQSTQNHSTQCPPPPHPSVSLAARLAVSLVAMVDVALLALGVSVALLVLLQKLGQKQNRIYHFNWKRFFMIHKTCSFFLPLFSSPSFRLQSNEITIFGKTVYLLVGLTIKLVVHFRHVVVFISQVAL